MNLHTCKINHLHIERQVQASFENDENEKLGRKELNISINSNGDIIGTKII